MQPSKVESLVHEEISNKRSDMILECGKGLAYLIHKYYTVHTLTIVLLD